MNSTPKKSFARQLLLVMISGRMLLVLFLIFAAVTAYYLYNKTGFSLEWLQIKRMDLENLIAQQYTLSVATYILIFVTATLFCIPITILLTVAAGYFFGVLWGTLYANIGATLGALCSFLVFRYFLGSFFKPEKLPMFDEFNQSIERYGHNYLLMMQLLPITPIFLINIFAGLTKIRMWTFVWTTSVGILPGVLIYTFAGRELAHISSVKEIVSAPMIIILVLLALLAIAPILVKQARS